MNENFIRDLEKQLQLKEFKLNSLLEITTGINSNLSVDQLISIYRYILREQLGFEKFMLCIKQEKWDILIKSGVKSKFSQSDIEKELLKFKEITVIESSYLDIINEFEVVIPVQHMGNPLAFLLVKGLNEENLKANNSLENLNFVQTLTNIIVVAIENKRMAKISLKQERLKKELEVASEMQKLLFPSDLPSDKRIDLAASHKTRHEVGGDYYDFIPLNDEEFIVCIADVSGKGISAAMLMANFQATIRTLFNYQRFDLEFLIHELNQKVMKSAKGEKFITFFIGQYNSTTRKLKYINAGHNHPILTNGKKATFLSKGCIGLGMFDEIPFLEPDEIKIPPNATLVLYTDGIVELENKEGEFYETDRLIDLIHGFYPLKMEDLNNLIFSKLDDWRGKREPNDDTALLTCRIF